MISVLIPCYNEKNTISEIVDRILKVKEIDIEIIIIDDNSKDGTKDIIENNLASKTALTQSYKLIPIAFIVRLRSSDCNVGNESETMGFKFPLAMLCNNIFILFPLYYLHTSSIILHLPSFPL